MFVVSAVRKSQDRAMSDKPRVRNIKRRPCRLRCPLPSGLFSTTCKDEGCAVLSVTKADCARLLELPCSLHVGSVAMPTGTSAESFARRFSILRAAMPSPASPPSTIPWHVNLRCHKPSAKSPARSGDSRSDRRGSMTCASHAPRSWRASSNVNTCS